MIMNMLKRADKSIFKDGDQIRIHFNVSGFDNFITGSIVHWASDGIAVSAEGSILYAPFGHILYVEKEMRK